jgi:hypothetical protein
MHGCNTLCHTFVPCSTYHVLLTEINFLYLESRNWWISDQASGRCRWRWMVLGCNNRRRPHQQRCIPQQHSTPRRRTSPHTTVRCSCQIWSTALLLTGHDFLGLLERPRQGEPSAAEQRQQRVSSWNTPWSSRLGFCTQRLLGPLMMLLCFVVVCLYRIECPYACGSFLI